MSHKAGSLVFYIWPTNILSLRVWFILLFRYRDIRGGTPVTQYCHTLSRAVNIYKLATAGTLFGWHMNQIVTI